MKKYNVIGILIFILSLISFGGISAAAPIQVTVDGVKQTYDQPPVLENGRTFVPLRGVFESLGATVAWDPSTQEITAEKDKQTIWLKIGSKTTKVNGSVHEIDVPATIKNKRTMVPLRFVSEALGAKVSWQAEQQLVEITTNSTSGSEKVDELPQFKQGQSGDPIVTMKTTVGDIKIILFPSHAPKAVENFLTHSKNGYYDGLTFHRVIEDFMIQGGDPVGNGTGGTSIWNTPFTDEFAKDLAHFRGALSMANSGPNTNGSQFFIVQAHSVDEQLISAMAEAGFNPAVIEKYKTIGGTPWLDHQHTVFGQVIEGIEIVDKIAAVETDSFDKPKIPILIKAITQQ